MLAIKELRSLVISTWSILSLIFFLLLDFSSKIIWNVLSSKWLITVFNLQIEVLPYIYFFIKLRESLINHTCIKTYSGNHILRDPNRSRDFVSYVSSVRLTQDKFTASELKGVRERSKCLNSCFCSHLFPLLFKWKANIVDFLKFA